jgi:hypothetical protein
MVCGVAVKVGGVADVGSDGSGVRSHPDLAQQDPRQPLPARDMVSKKYSVRYVPQRSPMPATAAHERPALQVFWAATPVPQHGWPVSPHDWQAPFRPTPPPTHA